MPATPDPDLALQLAKATVDVYSEATGRMLEIVAKRLARGITEPGWAERKLVEQARLRDEALQVLDDLQRDGAEAITEAIEQAYAVGAEQGVADLKVLGDEGRITAQFGATHTRAVEALVQETVTKVQSTHLRVLRSTLDAYRDIISEVSAPGVLTGTQTRREATQRALNRFAAKGITGFVDKAGRRWELEAYAEMATRTSVGRAQTQGTLDRFEAAGRDLVIVSDAPEECSVCLVPGTVVEGPIATGSARLEYTGDVVRIVTASGNDLTGTPDHAVLTPLGWRALKDLHPGDQVISDDRQQRDTRVVPDHVQVPALIEEAGEPGAPVLLAGPTCRDLDQGWPYREVRAVLTHDDLLAKRLPPFGQPLSDHGLVLGLRPFLGGDDLALCLGGAGDSSDCVMCRIEHGGAFLGAGVGPAALHGRGPLGRELVGVHGFQTSTQAVMSGPRLDASAPEVVRDHPTADAEGGAELLRALSGQVATDEVVSVGWRQFRGHVWDLSTRPGWFLANGIVTHNCRPWEGKVLSIGGATAPGTTLKNGFTVAGTVAEATGAGLFHANCRHALGAYIDGATRRMTDTEDPHGDTIRQEQRMLERTKRKWKREEKVALTDEARREARQQIAVYDRHLRLIVSDRRAYAQRRAEFLRSAGHPHAGKWERTAAGIAPGTSGKRLRYREQIDKAH